MNLSMKQKQKQNREQTGDHQGGGDGVGGWGQQIQAFMHRMNKQQSPTAQHKELYSICYDKP